MFSNKIITNLGNLINEEVIESVGKVFVGDTRGYRWVFGSAKKVITYFIYLFVVQGENHTAPCKQSKVSSILGNEYPSFIVLLFRLHRSIQNLSPPSFFLTSTTVLAHGLKLLLIAHTSTISWRWFFTSSYRWGGILWYLSLKGWGSVILMACFRILHLPRSKSFLEKTSANSTNKFLADCCCSPIQLSNPSKFNWSKIQDPPSPQW